MRIFLKNLRRVGHKMFDSPVTSRSCERDHDRDHDRDLNFFSMVWTLVNNVITNYTQGLD